MYQRDVFIKEIIKSLESDKSIYFLSADFGAAALDKLRKEMRKISTLIKRRKSSVYLLS